MPAPCRGDEGRQVGVGGVAGHGPQGGDRQRHEDGRLRRGLDPLPERRRRQAGTDAMRQSVSEAERRQRSQDRHAAEGAAPAHAVSHHGAERHAEGDRQRQAAIDDGDRTAAPFGCDHGAGQRIRARDIQAGGKSQQDARGHQLQIAGRGPGQDIGRGEDEHRADQQAAAADAAGEGGQYGRAERIGEGERRHQLAGLGQGDREVGGHARQQAGDHEAFGTDGEAAQRQPEQRRLAFNRVHCGLRKKMEPV
jgi:hypothetical protein